MMRLLGCTASDFLLRWGSRIAVSLRRFIGYREIILVAVFGLSAASFWLSYGVRYDFEVTEPASTYRLWLTPIVAVFKTLVFVMLRGHSRSWRYVGLRDAEVLLVHSLICSAGIWTLGTMEGFTVMRRGIVLIDFFVSSVLIGSFQISMRLVRERIVKRFRTNGHETKTRAIVFGAGDAGEMIIREILRSPTSDLKVLAAFDDNRRKHGSLIHGITVEGPLEVVPAYAAANRVDIALVAIPSASRDEMARIYKTLRKAGLRVRALPSLNKLLAAAPKLTQLQDVDITELLGRREIVINSRQVQDLIRDKIVLVTGAAGSIGSELSRQLLDHYPAKLLLMDRSENGLFHLHRQLTRRGGDERLVTILADVADSVRMNAEFATHRPQVVFHAAAHKHVALQELSPAECFKNNVGGVQALVKAVKQFPVELFLLISTDKAVNPRSVMGATKRVCEIYCEAASHVSPTTFASVRFGNVLGSNGSVVPIFMEQIVGGGPVTITHPEVERYFMTISEAVSLVLQAAALGKSGQVLVLDMGKPVRIVDLATQLIQLMGKNTADVPIEFIGLKHGEKLSEELLCDLETCEATQHESIRIYSQNGHRGIRDIERIDAAVRALSHQRDDVVALRLLSEIVPEYRHHATGPEDA